MFQTKTVTKRLLQAGQCICLKALLLVTATATAAIPPMQELYTGPDQYIEIDLNHWARLDLMFRPKSVNPERYIPLSELEDRMDQGDLAASILKQSFSTWMDEQERDSVWKTMNNAAQGLKADIRISTEDTTHKVKMKFNPVSTKASVKYQGFADTEFSYDLDDQSTKLEFSKQIDGITYLATHQNNDEGQSDILGVRWSF